MSNPSIHGNHQDSREREGLLALERDRRRDSETLLRQVTAEWMAVFDALPEAVFVVNADFTLRRVNQAAAKKHGCHPRELIGRKCYEVMHGLDQPIAACPHQTVLAKRMAATVEFDDTYLGYPLSITCIPFFEGTVHVVRDISQERHAMREREQLIALLQASLEDSKVLNGLIPICAWCKKIRDEQGHWQALEAFFRQHVEATFTHSICPGCSQQMREDQAAIEDAASRTHPAG